eukprot:4412720-Amphidinium_carterae.1
MCDRWLQAKPAQSALWLLQAQVEEGPGFGGASYPHHDSCKRTVSSDIYMNFIFNRCRVQRVRLLVMWPFSDLGVGLQRLGLHPCVQEDLKVAQLVGYVSEHVAYHHGESSLTEVIITMAQDFVGSNNLNLLVPQGQFGTRLQGGKDAAASRFSVQTLVKRKKCVCWSRSLEKKRLSIYNNNVGERYIYTRLAPVARA